MKIMRNYSEKDVKRLIISAGGRCSFRSHEEICNRLLISGNSVIGEKAHIIAVSRQGPRYDPTYDFGKINTYENLIWMCPTHHTIIDKLENVEHYSPAALRKMKADHESDVLNGSKNSEYRLYDVIAHDYANLSTLFEYVDINKLYSSCLDLPFGFDGSFTDLIDMVEAYEEGNGKFYLKDKYLNMLFVEILRYSRYLLVLVKRHLFVEGVEGGNIVFEFKCSPYPSATESQIQMIEYWLCKYQEVVEKFISAMKIRYPEILHQPLYKSVP